MKLHSDLVWANSLRWDLMCCSAATQADCPRQRSLQLSLELFSMLSFFQPMHFAHVCACACMTQCVVLYLSESDCPQRAVPSLAKQCSVYLWPGDLYGMWLDASLQGPQATTSRPETQLQHTSPGHRALRCPRISYPSLDLCPVCLKGFRLGCCRSVCRWLNIKKAVSLITIDSCQKTVKKVDHSF